MRERERERERGREREGANLHVLLLHQRHLDGEQQVSDLHQQLPVEVGRPLGAVALRPRWKVLEKLVIPGAARRTRPAASHSPTLAGRYPAKHSKFSC